MLICGFFRSLKPSRCHQGPRFPSLILGPPQGSPTALQLLPHLACIPSRAYDRLQGAGRQNSSKLTFSQARCEDRWASRQHTGTLEPSELKVQAAERRKLNNEPPPPPAPLPKILQPNALPQSLKASRDEVPNKDFYRCSSTPR